MPTPRHPSCVPAHRPLRIGVLVVLAVVLVACDAATASPNSTSTDSRVPASGSAPSIAPSPTPAVAPASPSIAPASDPPADPTAAPAPVALRRDTIAKTVVDRVRVRSAPGTGAASEKYKPLLPKGTELYVLDGPVAADGYDWYEVAPLDVRGFGQLSGWVAVASRDGEPWLREARPTCPPKPGRFTELLALSVGERLACFSGVPITVQARVLPCNCERDPGYSVEPGWFAGPPGDWWGGLLLVPPSATEADPFGDALDLVIDPDGSVPAEFPVGEVVTVTGTFDHPDATPCAMQIEGEPADHDFCRLRFAVTRMR